VCRIKLINKVIFTRSKFVAGIVTLQLGRGERGGKRERGKREREEREREAGTCSLTASEVGNGPLICIK
jgi:hypothetical protein